MMYEYHINKLPFTLSFVLGGTQYVKLESLHITYKLICHVIYWLEGIMEVVNLWSKNRKDISN